MKHVEFSSVDESSGISAVTISPCSKFVVVGLTNGYVQFWDVLESGLRFTNKYQLPDKSIPQVLSFDKLSSLIAIGDGNLGNIYMYNIDGAFCPNLLDILARFHLFLGPKMELIFYLRVLMGEQFLEYKIPKTEHFGGAKSRACCLQPINGL